MNNSQQGSGYDAGREVESVGESGKLAEEHVTARSTLAAQGSLALSSPSAGSLAYLSTSFWRSVALIIIGLPLVNTAAQDTYVELGRQVHSDFTPQKGSFLWYAVAIIVAGALGYIMKLRAISIGLVSLILLALFLSDKTFFSQLGSQLINPVAPVKPDQPKPSIDAVAGMKTGSDLPFYPFDSKANPEMKKWYDYFNNPTTKNEKTGPSLGEALKDCFSWLF
ncbi:MAG: hypothetical protein ACLPX9_08860 [Rhodomicrobium sp.]